MESFLVSLRVVIPMAILMAIGAVFRVKGIVDRPSMKKLDALLFRLFMPILLFKNIYDTNMEIRGMAGHFGFILVSLFIIFAFSFFVPRQIFADRRRAASVGQAIIRSNFILFGTVVARALYGDAGVGVVSLLGVLIVPLINIMAVIVLEVNCAGTTNPLKLALSVVRNPMIIGAIAAVVLKSAGIALPMPLYSVVRDIANATTTMCFISLGVSLDIGSARENTKALLIGNFLRMILVPSIFLPISAALGFRGQDMCALMVVFAAPAAVASYPMAVAMGADGQLSGQLVCTTTLASIFTIFCFTFILRSFGCL